jgi:hypothetical protein
MMSKIHISRDRQSLGHFFPGEVAVGLRTGRFLPTDLAWQDPMETWKPLSEFTDLPVVEEEPEVLPVVPEVAPPSVPEVASAGEPAWEQPGMAGVVGKLFSTIGQIFSRPGTTFRGLNPDGTIARALVYYLMLATVSSWVSLAYNVLVVLLVPGYLEKSPLGGKMTPSMMVAGSVLNALIAPFFLAGLAFVASGFLHLVLMLFGVSQPNFMLTVRVYCYAIGTAFLMMLIPGCGVLIFLPCAILLLIVGLKEAHRTDFVRPAIAVVVPAVVLLFLYGLLIVAVQSGAIK